MGAAPQSACCPSHFFFNLSLSSFSVILSLPLHLPTPSSSCPCPTTHTFKCKEGKKAVTTIATIKTPVRRLSYSIQETTFWIFPSLTGKKVFFFTLHKQQKCELPTVIKVVFLYVVPPTNLGSITQTVLSDICDHKAISHHAL